MANEPPWERYWSEIIDSKLYDRNEVMNNDTITSDTKEIIQYAYNLMYLS